MRMWVVEVSGVATQFVAGGSAIDVQLRQRLMGSC